MIYDANAFLGKWPHWPVRATTAEEVARELDGWRITRAAVVSTRALFVNCQDGNREAEAAAARFPQRFAPFACLDAQEAGRGFDFDACARRGFRGIRLYPQHHSYHPLFVPFVDQILEDAAARLWPVMIALRVIMNWGMPMLELGVIHALVERHPHVNWILAGINYLHELQMAQSLLHRFPNVHLETSCVMGFDAIRKLVGECGSAQLLFGSGAPLMHGGAGVEKILRAKIPEAAREAILSGNARRLIERMSE